MSYMSCMPCFGHKTVESLPSSSLFQYHLSLTALKIDVTCLRGESLTPIELCWQIVGPLHRLCKLNRAKDATNDLVLARGQAHLDSDTCFLETRAHFTSDFDVLDERKWCGA